MDEGNQHESEDRYWRSSIALSQAWAIRLRAILSRKQIKLPEQVRRWIAQEEWMDVHTGPDAAQPLYIRTDEGTYERIRMVHL